jgi:hypothetical protein
MQFIESVRTDPEPESKSQKCSCQSRRIDPGRQGGSNCNIREVPNRVRHVEERHEIAQPTAAACIERGS